jgi:hypothetical protein
VLAITPAKGSETKELASLKRGRTVELDSSFFKLPPFSKKEKNWPKVSYRVHFVSSQIMDRVLTTTKNACMGGTYCAPS